MKRIISTLSSSTSRLRLSYIVALGIIAALLLATEIYTRFTISNNNHSGELINVAGRQRMFSQKISRDGLLLANLLVDEKITDAKLLGKKLNPLFKNWKKYHNQLLSRSNKSELPGTNSQQIQNLYTLLQPNVEVFSQSTERVLTVLNADSEFEIGHRELIVQAAIELANSSNSYLAVMDEIVNRYANESDQNLSSIVSVQDYFIILILIAMLVLAFWVFEPSIRIFSETMRLFDAQLNAIDKTNARIEFSVDGEIIDANTKFLQWTKLCKSDLRNLTYRDFVPGDLDCKSFWHDLKRGQPQIGEFFMATAPSSQCWLNGTYNPVLSKDGAVEKIVFYATNTTLQKNLLLELDTAQAARDRAIDGSNDGLWNYNPITKECWYSNQYKSLLGYHEEEFNEFEAKLSSFVSRLHPDDSKASMTAMDAHLRDPNASYDVEFRLKKENGEYAWFRARGQAERGPGGSAVLMAGSITDISQQKDLEDFLRAAMAELEEATVASNQLAARAEAANLAKSEFLANMSHEIRTPITAIMGYADLLENDEELRTDPAQAANAVRYIRSNGSHLLAIINDILDISKIQAGKMSIEVIEIDLVEVIRETLLLLKPRAKGKQLPLITEPLTDIPQTIQTDPIRLKQVIINLVSNAIKFTESGAITIRTSCDPEKQKLTIAVSDTGVGMTPDQLASISQFTAFNQADASTTRKFGGTGLGLKISNSLANMLGGQLEIQSVYGKGSEFTVSISTGSLENTSFIPANQVGFENVFESIVGPNQDNEMDPETALAGIQILLAEDGPDNQRLITHILKKAGAEVTLAENGRIALRVIQDKPDFDIILMDMLMPDLDGYGATRMIRRKGIQIPIIALTANAMSGDREKCLDAGCDDYATKPIDRKALIKRIQDHVGAKLASPLLT